MIKRAKKIYIRENIGYNCNIVLIGLKVNIQQQDNVNVNDGSIRAYKEDYTRILRNLVTDIWYAAKFKNIVTVIS